MSAEAGGLSLELGIYDELVPGQPSFIQPLDEELVRVILPADSFLHPVSTLDGVPIRNVSPLALLPDAGGVHSVRCVRAPPPKGRREPGAPSRAADRQVGRRSRTPDGTSPEAWVLITLLFVMRSLVCVDHQAIGRRAVAALGEMGARSTIPAPIGRGSS